eukprot:1322009-Heterocapsa_arctica.AAC.1
MEVQKDNCEQKDDAAGAGLLINKQARKRAEENQAEVNENKGSKHIEAHQTNNEFDLPTEAPKHIENTDEQTNR